MWLKINASLASCRLRGVTEGLLSLGFQVQQWDLILTQPSSSWNLTSGAMALHSGAPSVISDSL